MAILEEDECALTALDDSLPAALVVLLEGRLDAVAVTSKQRRAAPRRIKRDQRFAKNAPARAGDGASRSKQVQ